MHTYMLSDALQTLVGDAAFSLCFFFPGYLVASSYNLMGFRSRSMPEKLLWSVALSGPLSTLFCCLGGRILPPRNLLFFFAMCSIFAAYHFMRDLWQFRSRWQQEFARESCIAAACMVAVALYCLLATLAIQTPHSLYEGVIATDWSIRVPLVDAAVRGGIPPHNPMFALAGHAPPMRYYYFWYELCAQVIRLTHISAHNCLAASTVWSAYSLIAVTFLALKYLAPQHSIAPIFNTAPTADRANTDLKRICLAALGLMCVMGLDLLNAVNGLFQKPMRIYPDIEAWHPDRMPSWPGSILFAPHHVAGVAFGTLGFLLLALLPESRRQKLLHSLLAAVCFAALVGTSSYLALCFGVAGVFLFAVRLCEREWLNIAFLVLCGAVAVLLSLPFLHEMTSTVAYAAVEHPRASTTHSLISNHMLKVVVRSWHMAFGVIGTFAQEHNLPYEHIRIRYLFPLMLLPVLYFTELTFYVFVLWYQAKADFFSGTRPNNRALALWTLFFGFALPALFLSSEPTQGINDLGRHAGLALRLVLIAWAAPMMLNTWHSLRSHHQPNRGGRWIILVTAVCIMIGLGGQLWQITMDRLYLPLIAHNVFPSKIQYQTGAPFLQARRANDAIAANLAPNAVIQSDPDSRYQSVFLLYLNRQTAAGDDGCEAAFGGNVNLCQEEVAKPLHALFGGDIKPRELDPGEVPPEPPNAANMTDAHFRATCSQLHLSALLATSVNVAWNIPGSWVWNEPASSTIYADDAVRVISCPR